jgi:hydrogenase maturation protease
MNLSLVEKIADAVLYEGYILYPYRPSSVKNQQRWNFGALCPESYSLAQRGTESWTMQTECLVQQRPQATLEVKVRFLHLLTREVGRRIADCQLSTAECGHSHVEALHTHFALVPLLEVKGQLFQTWQEAVERQVSVPAISLDKPADESTRLAFYFPASESIEPLHAADGEEILGALLRRQEAIEGTIEVKVSYFGLENVRQVTVRILNQTPLEDADLRSRDEALMRSFVSTHTILSVHHGEFVSLLDPPEAFREAAGGCNNIGTYPVLAGDEGTHDCMLSSPIILYDYPQIAPESAGSLFDGTEIDEILTLRIMTLTDDEKREMRGGDDRARQILERTETLPVEQLMKMHGAMKSVKKAGQ